MSKTYAYYPGCSSMGTSAEYDRSTRAVCRACGIDLEDVHDWTCCGSTPAHVTDFGLSGALAARNLVQAKSAGRSEVLTPCPSCLKNMKAAQHHAHDPVWGPRIERLLGRKVPGDMRCASVLEILFRETGAEGVRALVKKPLTGLKVACYYGCLLTRPTALMEFDEPENPQSMETLLAATGATVLDFPLKVECCGASLAVVRRDMVQQLSGRLLDTACELGADVLSVACPLCQMNLDLRQKQAACRRQTKAAVPIMYVTQLLGLAFGLDEADLGLGGLIVDPRPVLAGIGARGEEAADAPAGGQDDAKAVNSGRAE